MDILLTLQDEFKLKKAQVENTVKLIDEGNTIPFIARYRKELTGSLDDQVLRELFDRLTYLRNLNERRLNVFNLITEQEKMTDEIEESLKKAKTLTEIEDIYRPFKPKRRTRATIAKEKGLEPLANIIFAQKLNINIEDAAKDFINEEKEVNTIEDAIEGAKDIIAEIISDDATIRSLIRNKVFQIGKIKSVASDKEAESVYEMYYEYEEKISSIASHRVLALNRGESENFLSIKVVVDDELILKLINKKVNEENKYTDATISEVVEDSYSRLIFPSIERDIRNSLTDVAQEGAIKVFGENLGQLLMQVPIKGKTVLAFDPGFRTGCKIACVDETGKVLYTDVAYCTPPQNKIEESFKKLVPVIEKHNVDMIAIGNGTASRETESFVVDLIKKFDKKIYYVMVNEAGASVYSASKLAATEFPEYDVAIRSAISIARRLQDPLAELVKIDPKSIGVGQYQHDMNQKRLDECLSGVVESCVNSVGVDLSTASASLLSYIAGVSKTVANNIVAHREAQGVFKNRKQLLKVKSLGPKTYEQCVGFLRIADGENVLDNTAVHPESYDVAEKLIKSAGFTLDDVKKRELENFNLEDEDIERISKELEIGIPTLKDIVSELKKPGRDPREDMPLPLLRSDVLLIEDLEEGMVLYGTVRNLIDFGIFVDIGVHHDGLVHISEISDAYIKHPLDVVKVGDVIRVKVMSVDLAKARIALTMRGIE